MKQEFEMSLLGELIVLVYKYNKPKMVSSFCKPNISRRSWRSTKCKILNQYVLELWYKYDTGVVLDGNSLRWHIIVQQVNSKELMIRKRYTQVHHDKGAYTRGLADQKKRIEYTRTFTEGKACTCWKTKFWSVIFGPWYFDPWYWSIVFGLRYWPQVLGPRYWS